MNSPPRSLALASHSSSSPSSFCAISIANEPPISLFLGLVRAWRFSAKHFWASAFRTADVLEPLHERKLHGQVEGNPFVSAIVTMDVELAASVPSPHVIGVATHARFRIQRARRELFPAAS